MCVGGLSGEGPSVWAGTLQWAAGPDEKKMQRKGQFTLSVLELGHSSSVPSDIRTLCSLTSGLWHVHWQFLRFAGPQRRTENYTIRSPGAGAFRLGLSRLQVSLVVQLEDGCCGTSQPPSPCEPVPLIHFLPSMSLSCWFCLSGER